METPLDEMVVKLKLLQYHCQNTDCAICPIYKLHGADCRVNDVTKVDENISLLSLVKSYEEQYNQLIGMFDYLANNSTPLLTADSISEVKFDGDFTEVHFANGFVSRVKRAFDDADDRGKAIMIAILKSICTSRREYRNLMAKINLC